MTIQNIQFWIFILIILSSCNSNMESSQGKDFTSKINAIESNDNALQLSFFEKERQPNGLKRLIEMRKL